MNLKLDKNWALFGTTINQNLKNRTVSQMKMATKYLKVKKVFAKLRSSYINLFLARNKLAYFRKYLQLVAVVSTKYNIVL